MSEQHIMQVRDLIAELQRQPEDAEVEITIGGTRHFINKIGYSSAYRRTVNLDVDGEDRIKELEAELERYEQDTVSSVDYDEAVDLLKKLDSISQDGGTPLELEAENAELAAEVRRFLKTA